jgi:predicted ribosome quality control (RQC) complex YloA/Tae2 family protein
VNLDALTLRLLCAELDLRFAGGKVRTIYQIGHTDLLFLFWKGRELWLHVGFSPGKGLMREQQGKEGQALAPSSFCMLLRKHLSGMRLERIRQEPWERLVRMDFAGDSDRWLILELAGRNPNLILTSETGTILGAASRASSGSKVEPPAEKRERDLRTGRQYIPPHRQPCVTLDDLTNAGLPPFEDERIALHKALTSLIFGINRNAATEIALSAGLDPQAPAALEEGQRASLLKALKTFRTRLDEAPSPTVILKKEEAGGRLVPCAVLPWLYREWEAAPYAVFPTMSHAVTFFCEKADTEDSFEKARAEALGSLKKRLDKMETKLSRQERDFSALQQSLAGKRMGDLLHIYGRSIPPEITVAEVEDIIEGKGEIVAIPIDPGLSSIDMAQRYFERYRRAKRGSATLMREMERTRAEVEELRNRRSRIESARSLQEIEAAWASSTAEKAPKRNLSSGPLPPRRYHCKGYEILVGRNPSQNEEITFHTAAREDIWLHVRQSPGAHVIIRRGSRKDDIPPEVIEEAAALAAFWSRAKTSSKCAVDYTLAKYVRKPPGTPRGHVTYERAKTIIVRPEPTLQENP